MASSEPQSFAGSGVSAALEGFEAFPSLSVRIT